MFAAIREVFGWPDLFLGLAVVLAGVAGAVLLPPRESRPPGTREIAPGGVAAGNLINHGRTRPRCIHSGCHRASGK